MSTISFLEALSCVNCQAPCFVLPKGQMSETNFDSLDPRREEQRAQRFAHGVCTRIDGADNRNPGVALERGLQKPGKLGVAVRDMITE